MSDNSTHSADFRKLFPLSDDYECKIADADSVIDDYRDGLLADETRDAFEEHLMYCQSCGEGLELRQNVATILYRQATKGKSKYLYWAVAAVLFLAFSLPFLLRDSFENNLNQYETARAETGRIELADGSIIDVNYDSKVGYIADFGVDERLVTLEGEAYFQIAASPIPFVIKTGNSRIQVTGTQFNVWSRTGETRVTVAEGSVSFTAGEGSAVSLQANEMSISIGGKAPNSPQAVNAQYLIGWLDNKLVFQNASLADILTELERAYDVAVTADASINTQETRLSFDTIKGPIENVLETVCFQLGLRFEIDGRQVKIEAL